MLLACLLHVLLPRHRRFLGAGLHLNQLSRFRGPPQYPHHDLPGKLHLYGRLATEPGAVPASQPGAVGRRDQQRYKPRNRSLHLLAPTIDLAWRNVRAASDLGNDSARREALRDDRPLLLLALATPPLNTGDYRNSHHRTVASTSASTVICTGAKPAGYHPARRPSRPHRSSPDLTGRVHLYSVPDATRKRVVEGG
jgi:hypothetical protein